MIEALRRATGIATTIANAATEEGEEGATGKMNTAEVVGADTETIGTETGTETAAEDGTGIEAGIGAVTGIAIGIAIGTEIGSGGGRVPGRGVS